MIGNCVALLVSAALFCAAAAARSPACDEVAKTRLNSFLWTIRRPGAPVYFFGTIHVPYTRVWDFIPQNAKDAFRNSESVFFELDLTNHYTAAQLASCQLLPAGETLDKVLPRDLYRRLRKHFNYLKRKMPDWLRPPAAASAAAGAAAAPAAGSRPRAEPHPMYADYQFNAMAGSWERLRPVWVMLTLNSLTESEVRSFGVPVLDLYLSQQAVRWSKHTGAIEKVEEQCTPLNQLNLNQVIFALNQTLTQHELQREQSSASVSLNDDLIHHYSCGDLDSVLFSRDVSRVPALGVPAPGSRSAASASPPLAPEQSRLAKEIDGYFQTELLYKRNERMAERVASLLRDHPKRSFFFAFGAGHFLGHNTVIDHLRRAGFTVNHMPAQQQIASFSQKEFSTDLSVPVPLNPYIEALTSFNQMHSAKIRQRLHKQGRRQELDSSLGSSGGVPSWRETKQAKQPPADQRPPSPASTAPAFNSLWKRIDDESHQAAVASEPEAATSPPASRPGRVWRPSQSSKASSSFVNSYGRLLLLIVALSVGSLDI